MGEPLEHQLENILENGFTFFNSNRNTLQHQYENDHNYVHPLNQHDPFVGDLGSISPMAASGPTRTMGSGKLSVLDPFSPGTFGPAPNAPGTFGSHNPYARNLQNSMPSSTATSPSADPASRSASINSSLPNPLEQASQQQQQPSEPTTSSQSNSNNGSNPVGGLLSNIVTQLGKPEIANPLGLLLGPLLGHSASGLISSISNPIMEQKKLDLQRDIYNNENQIAQSHGYISAASMNGNHGPLTGNPGITRPSGGQI